MRLAWPGWTPASHSQTIIVTVCMQSVQTMVYRQKRYYTFPVDRGSLSTNHELASQTHHQMPDVSTAGLQSSSGQTSMQVQA